MITAGARNTTMCQGKLARAGAAAGRRLAVSLDMAVASPRLEVRRRPSAGRRSGSGYFCCGAYQEAKPFCSWAAPSCGVCVPLTTLAETTHISFHRLGVPRLMIW